MKKKKTEGEKAERIEPKARGCFNPALIPF
jgi:hypothetical protein